MGTENKRSTRPAALVPRIGQRPRPEAPPAEHEEERRTRPTPPGRTARTARPRARPRSRRSSSWEGRPRLPRSRKRYSDRADRTKRGRARRAAPASSRRMPIASLARRLFRNGVSLNRRHYRTETAKGPSQQARRGRADTNRIGDINRSVSETKRILFLCTGNAARSQMAEALARIDYGDLVEPVSAGSRPAGFVHPLAVPRSTSSAFGSARVLETGRGVPRAEARSRRDRLRLRGRRLPRLARSPPHRQLVRRGPELRPRTTSERLAAFRRPATTCGAGSTG